LTQIAQFRAHRHDDWGLGLNHKHRLARHWAWFASLSFSGDVGPLAQLLGLHSARGEQGGLFISIAEWACLCLAIPTGHNVAHARLFF